MKTIVVIDDDIYISSLISILLEKNGYRVIKGYSGTEALLLLEKERPDLVLLDLMLPGISGEEVLSKIKGIPVIVISAKDSPKDKVSSLLGGAVHNNQLFQYRILSPGQLQYVAFVLDLLAAVIQCKALGA